MKQFWRVALPLCTVWSVCAKVSTGWHRFCAEGGTLRGCEPHRSVRKFGFVPMIEGFCCVVCISGRCEMSTRFSSDRMVAGCAHQRNGRHGVVVAFKTSSEWVGRTAVFLPRLPLSFIPFSSVCNLCCSYFSTFFLFLFLSIFLPFFLALFSFTFSPFFLFPFFSFPSFLSFFFSFFFSFLVLPLFFSVFPLFVPPFPPFFPFILAPAIFSSSVSIPLWL